MGPGSKPVLVVEDEPDVRSVLKAMLAASGFDVVVAKDGASALRELWKRGGKIQVLVTDVDMGRMNGMELAESVRAQYPKLPILFVSGLPVPAAELEKVAPGTMLLAKPFGAADLVEAVQKLSGGQG
jgi:CheY-like chemotaxis protein